MTRFEITVSLLIFSTLCLSAVLVQAQSQWLASIVLAGGLALCAAIDIKRLLIPDIIVLPLILAGLAFAVLHGAGQSLESAIGAMAGYVGFAGLSLLYERVRGQPGLGLGDAKLMAAAGAWLGWPLLPFVMLVASLSGLVYALASRAIIQQRPQLIAFGPHIGLGIWVIWLYREILIQAFI